MDLKRTRLGDGEAEDRGQMVARASAVRVGDDQLEVLADALMTAFTTSWLMLRCVNLRTGRSRIGHEGAENRLRRTDEGTCMQKLRGGEKGTRGSTMQIVRWLLAIFW